MSLKAKLEAVVYAAEEPVTLAQLAAILTDEVLPLLDQAAELPVEPEAEQIALTGLAEESGQTAVPEPPAAASEDTPASEEPSRLFPAPGVRVAASARVSRSWS